MTNYKPIIKEFDFNNDTPDKILSDGFYVDWPVVYLINDDKSIYIGETYHSPTRMKQHLSNPEKNKLKKLHIIASDDFTKSSTLDIESSLIDLFYTDKELNKNKLSPINKNSGLVNHNYHDKNEFRQDSKFFLSMWNQLKKLNLVTGDVVNLKNSDLFKYSPYKALNPEQCVARDGLLESIRKSTEDNKKQYYFVDGSAGTGKTILALYLLRLLTYTDPESLKLEDDEQGEMIPEYLNNLIKIKKAKPDLKVGYVVAMTSLRNTLQKVCSKVKGLCSSMVIAPGDVFKDNYDVLIVDEAHRLMKRKNLTGYGQFDINNNNLGLGKEGTQLDWIMNKSDIQILFYDGEQSVKPSDVDASKFEELIKNNEANYYKLSSQMRCLSGRNYVEYIKDVLNEKNPDKIKLSNNYEVELFENFGDFLNKIKTKENECELSRIVSGYGFKWISKKDSCKPDIVIGDYKLYWNKTEKAWPLSLKGEQVIKEAGCIHTIQGYDLNYCGVIFGPEIIYRDGHIEIDKEKYFDAKGKAGINDKQLKEYILNIYSVLLTRGIHGTYIYVCDEELREYLKKYFG